MFDADAGIDGKPLVAAVDIGGTKIAGALVDSSGTLLATTRRPTPATAGAQTVLGAVREVLADLAADGRWPEVSAVGIGSAGPVDVAAGTVSPVNIAAWRGFPLVDEVRRQVGLPVTLIGDGVAIAEAEHRQGAATGYRSVLCMVVSTGVGGGLVLDGRVHDGPTGNAGHIGHISVDLDGEPCPCGGRGCVEGLASGPAIAGTPAPAAGVRAPTGTTRPPRWRSPPGPATRWRSPPSTGPRGHWPRRSRRPRRWWNWRRS
ncbi:hypothetical protein GCM10010440_44070 [Kitasatospora cinereorecta]